MRKNVIKYPQIKSFDREEYPFTPQKGRRRPRLQAPLCKEEGEDAREPDPRGQAVCEGARIPALKGSEKGISL